MPTEPPAPTLPATRLPHRLRAHYVQAAGARLDALSPAGRDLLAQRLAQLAEAPAPGTLPDAHGQADAHPDQAEHPVTGAAPPQSSPVQAGATPCHPPPPAHAALAALRARLDAARQARQPAGIRQAWPALPALDETRALWARLRTERQLRQSLQPAPENAGPLNSGSLVHRALGLMRSTSPGYLQHFLGYVDTLAWLDHLHQAGALPGDATPAPTTGPGRPAKPGAARPGKRRR